MSFRSSDFLSPGLTLKPKLSTPAILSNSFHGKNRQADWTFRVTTEVKLKT
jgi:hypothetical protein